MAVDFVSMYLNQTLAVGTMDENKVCRVCHFHFSRLDDKYDE